MPPWDNQEGSSFGRLHVERGQITQEEGCEMHNILGFAMVGNLAAVQMVFADEKDMVSSDTACAACTSTVPVIVPCPPAWQGRPSAYRRRFEAFE